MRIPMMVKKLLVFVVAFLMTALFLPQAIACKGQKSSRSVASTKSLKTGKKISKKKKAKKKKTKVARPARVRIIDTGKKVGPDNFPIPDVDRLNQDIYTSGSSELSSHLPQDEFQEFESP